MGVGFSFAVAPTEAGALCRGDEVGWLLVPDDGLAFELVGGKRLSVLGVDASGGEGVVH